MKVKCITKKVEPDVDNSLSYRFITIDKIYNAYEKDKNYYIILDDNNEIEAYVKTCFVDIIEMREDKLKELGI